MRSCIGVNEISTNYNDSGESFSRKSTIVDNYFSSKIASTIQNLEPKTMAKCHMRSDCNLWKEAIKVELDSLYKRKIFTSVLLTPCNVFPMGYKWDFIRK